jgi:hypothetical protein
MICAGLAPLGVRATLVRPHKTKLPPQLSLNPIFNPARPRGVFLLSDPFSKILYNVTITC